MMALLLTTSMTLCIGFSSAAVSATTTNQLYGLVNIALEESSSNAALKSTVSSKASRLGVKGGSKLGDSHDIAYKIEYGIHLQGSSTRLREGVVMLSSELGGMKLGYSNTPFKLSQGKVDVFNDVVDMKLLLPGDNVADLLRYQSPTFHNWRLNVAYIANDDTQPNSHGTSSSLQYSQGKLYFAMAYENNVTEQELFRVSTSYHLDAWRFGYLYQTQLHHKPGNRNENGQLFSLSYTFNALVIKSQYIQSDFTRGNKGFYGLSGAPLQSLSFGLDYHTQQPFTWSWYVTHGRVRGDQQEANNKRTIFGMGLKTWF